MSPKAKPKFWANLNDSLRLFYCKDTELLRSYIHTLTIYKILKYSDSRTSNEMTKENFPFIYFCSFSALILFFLNLLFVMRNESMGPKQT